MDRLAQVNKILTRYQEQLAGLENALIVAEPAGKVRLRHQIEDLQAEMRPFEAEKAQLLAGSATVEGRSFVEIRGVALASIVVIVLIYLVVKPLQKFTINPVPVSSPSLLPIPVPAPSPSLLPTPVPTPSPDYKYSELEFQTIQGVLEENLESIGSLLIKGVQPGNRSRYVDTNGLDVLLKEEGNVIQVTLSVEWKGGLTGTPFVNQFRFKISQEELVHDLDVLVDDGFDSARNVTGTELSLKEELDDLIDVK